MSQFSYYWTTSGSPSGDQVTSYTQVHLATISGILAAANRPNGICPEYDSGLAPSANGSNSVRVASGAALVDGKPFENTANEDISIPSAVGGGNTRIDRIVARADWSAFTVRLTRIAGVDSASPTVPALTQTSGSTYDIPVCQVLVDTSGNVTVTDERQWGHPHVDESTLTESSGVLKVKDGGIGEDQLADLGVKSTKIDSNAVETTKIKNLAVTEAKIDNNAVTSNKLEDGAVYSAKIADNAVTSAKINGSAVTTAKIANDAVTSTKIANDTILKDNIADEAVDYEKVGDRVLKLTHRKGGSATNWSTEGTTNYSLENVQAQAGAVETSTIINPGFAQAIVVTFPVSFDEVPLVFCQIAELDYYAEARVTGETASQFQINVANTHASTPLGSGVVVNWIAFGKG